MDLVSEETTQSAKHIVYKEGALLSLISYVLRTYAYLVIGTVLALVNIPIFFLVLTRKTLRNTYLVLAFVFLNNGFTGISSILLGMKRLIDTASGERSIDHHHCVLNVPLLLLTAYSLNGLSLLMNSMERFSVVAFPIYYYTHSTRICYSVIAAQYTITIVAITTTTVASFIEPARRISNFCLLQSVYSPIFYKALVLMTSTTSLLSIAFMVTIVVILRRKFGAKFLSSHSHNRDLSQFLKNQKRYTQTALISCCFTFFLAVVPSMVQYIYILDPTSRSRTIVIACVYLPFLNSFNMITLFICRQGDLRRATIYSLKWLFCGRKHRIQPTTVVEF
ncbi:putative integral membrane protein [Brugia pahangi]